jgi:predicted O-methyltransferase YrrM
VTDRRGEPDGADAAVAAVADVEGWLSGDQARRLWDRASRVEPPGRIVEIGSYRGRSAIVLARAARPGVGVHAIDPHAGNDRGPQQIEGSASEGEADHRAFEANLARAGVADRVVHVRLPSQDALAHLPGPVDLLYVDGAHRLGPAAADIGRWGARVRPGGAMLVHDAFSSVGVTLALLGRLGGSARFRYAGRTGSLAEYVREPVRGRRRVANAARQVAELPWFARNLAVKLAIVAGRPGLARALGHRSGPWPY